MRPFAGLDRHFLAELRRRSVFKVAGAYLIAGWLLIQVASTVAPQFDLPAWAPRLVTLLVLLGFPLAIVLAWAFEFTPEGVARDARSRSTRFIVALASVLTVSALAWFFRSELAGTDAGERSIAVLPFANLATDADSDVLADGLAEELLGALGRNPAFRVTARSSAFQFKGQNRDLREIGQKLGVRYILEGSVRMAANRVRIGAQLVDTEDGTQLWNESYDRTLADLFALQRDIAYEVEQALEVVLVASEGPARGTASVEAHLELLRALKIGASRVVGDLDQAIAHLQRAIAIDPDYAAAYVELAYAIYTRALQLGDYEAVKSIIAPLIDKALALDPGLGEAMVLRGSILIDDPALAEKTIRDGLALAPSHARGYEILAGHVSRDVARTDEALALLDRALALDPLSPRNHQMKGILLWHVEGKFQNAVVHFRRAFELEPRFRNALRWLVIPSMMEGEFAAAVDYAERLLQFGPDAEDHDTLVVQLLNIGDLAAAREASRSASPMARIAVLVAAGDNDGAMAQLRALPKVPGGFLAPFVVHPLALRHAVAHGSWSESIVLSMRGFDGKLVEEAVPEAIAYAHWIALLRGAGRGTEADELERAALARLDRLDAQQYLGLLPMFAWQRAMVHAAAGRSVEALDALERAFVVPRPFWWVMLDGNPMFESLRNEPRYVALRERLGQQIATQRTRLAELRARAPVAAPGDAGSARL